MNKGRSRVAVLLLIAVIIAGIVFVVQFYSGSEESTSLDQPAVAPVTRGPMVISTSEIGSVEAMERIVIGNDLKWPVIIKSVVKHGSLVKSGGVIVEFICKPLDDALDAEILKVNSAELAYQQAEKNLQLKQKAVSNEVNKATNVLTLAQEKLRRYKDKGGQWEIDLNDADSKIQTARQELVLAEDKLSFKEQVNSDPALKSPYSKNEIEADRLSVKQLQLSLAKAEANKQMLIKYDNPQQLRRLQEDVDQATIDLERTRLEQESEVALKTHELNTRKHSLASHREQLDELKQQQKKLIVTAQKDGLVLYLSELSRRESESVVKIGETVGPRRRLLLIPDMTTLQFETNVFEALIHNLQVQTDQQKGTEVIVRLDSIPGQDIPGRVKWIAPIPRQRSRFMPSGAKVYELRVEMDYSVSNLAPGRDIKPDMEGEVEIILHRFEDVLTVPLEAVHYRDGRYYCWKLADGLPVIQEVVIGKMSADRVCILEGLKESEQVLLSAQQQSSDLNGQHSSSSQ